MLPLTSASPLNALTEFISRAVAAGVDLLQIRERDLPVRDLMTIAGAAAGLARGSNTRILVNDRADVAACAHAGVHLTTRSLTPAVARESFGPEILLGASTHSLEEAEEAERGGANFVVFGPVFETGSKREYGPPVGIDALRAVSSRLQIPVLALGGIRESNFRQTLDAGAAGVAGISLFSDQAGLQRIVRVIKGDGL